MNEEEQLQLQIHFKDIDTIKNSIMVSNDKIYLYKKINSSNKILDSDENIDNVNVNTIGDEDVFFIASKIIEANNILLVEGSIGYHNDPQYIRLIYNIDMNKIYIVSSYRTLHVDNDDDMFNGTFTMVSGKLLGYDLDNGILTLNETTTECPILKINNNGVPYYRFPRSKDGIEIPRVIHNIFKVFEDETVTKPEIIIQSEWYYYNIYKYIR